MARRLNFDEESDVVTEDEGDEESEVSARQDTHAEDMASSQPNNVIEIVCQHEPNGKYVLLTPTYLNGYAHIPIVWGYYDSEQEVVTAVKASMTTYQRKEGVKQKDCLFSGKPTGYRFLRRPVSKESFEAFSFVNIDLKMPSSGNGIKGFVFEYWMETFGFSSKHIAKSLGISSSVVNKAINHPQEYVPNCLYLLYRTAQLDGNALQEDYNLSLIDGISYDERKAAEWLASFSKDEDLPEMTIDMH